MALSLRYGGGNPRWFHELPRETQVEVLALHRLEHDEAKEQREAAEARARSRRKR